MINDIKNNITLEHTRDVQSGATESTDEKLIQKKNEIDFSNIDNSNSDIVEKIKNQISDARRNFKQKFKTDITNNVTGDEDEDKPHGNSPPSMVKVKEEPKRKNKM